MSLPNAVFPLGSLELVGSRPLARAGVVAGRVLLRSKPSLPSRIAVIGNYLPRQCGIATFTTDLCGAISAEYGTAPPAWPCRSTTRTRDMTIPDGCDGRWRRMTSRRHEEAAQFLNFNNIDMVCLQHEYGIFGGPAGSHILHLLRKLKMPVVTTLHRTRAGMTGQTLIRCG